MRTERVPKDVDAGLHVRAPCGAPQHHLNDFLLERFSFRIAQHSRTAEVSRVTQCVSQTLREWNIPQPIALRHGHVTFPLGASHAQLSLVEIDIRPLGYRRICASFDDLPGESRGVGVRDCSRLAVRADSHDESVRDANQHDSSHPEFAS